MAYRKNLTNDQIVPLAMRGGEGRTVTGNMSTDSFRIGRERAYAPHVGSLPGVWERWLNERFRAGAIGQVIYSYSTPIAWFDVNYGWTIPDVTYSATTSTKHQVHLRRTTGRRVSLPWDATDSDLRRVMDGEMVFIRAGRWGGGPFIGTRPGPNYVEA